MSFNKVKFFNVLIRIVGNIVKLLSYPFHIVFPKFRFTIPVYSPKKVVSKKNNNIPKVIWQTNYSNKSTLPVYVNYLFNRLMSLDYEYRYVSTEERDVYLRNNAPKEVYASYKKLTDGAAQADLWRVATLYMQGGIYMDIDATLVRKLNDILGMDDALYISYKNGTELTNYFLATKPKNPDYKRLLEAMIFNINNYDPKLGVYGTTGPGVFNNVIDISTVTSKERRSVCIQGAFTNEHFQYLDKPRGKWTHADRNTIVK
ncbi:glycosyltransferase family 32 protein [Vibrio profundum]|uniref:glycosyltransferase family 32 protein n=1 Tax=Vibrio profundum TaxID=2910247 RepID=UPI003D0B6E33